MTPDGGPIVQARGVSKSYGAVKALQDVDFSISRGEVRALLGKNGAGKSTLIRMFAGVESPDRGTIHVQGRDMANPSIHAAKALGIQTVYQELSLIPHMTVAENLFMGSWPRSRGVIRRADMLKQSRAMLESFDLDLDPRTPVSELSIAEQQLVEIARAVNSSPSLLILDEPTSSLSSREVDRVLNTVTRISNAGVAVIYVSHRLAEIRRIADSATIMRDGRVIDTRPLNDVSTEEVARAMIGDAESHPPILNYSQEDRPLAVSVRDITVAPKLTGISFEIRSGEVLGIAGLLGSGRTELLQAIAGARPVDSGEIVVFGGAMQNKGSRSTGRLGVGMTPEDRKVDGIIPELGVDENLAMSSWRKVSSLGIIRRRRLTDAAQHLIRALSVRTGSTRTPMRNLSGGNQQKIVIGRLLHASSRVLLLDEPTRGVDVEAKNQIYGLLRRIAQEGAAVVFVSSEIEELHLVSDRVLVLNDGRVTAEYRAPGIDTERLLVAAMAGE